MCSVLGVAGQSLPFSGKEKLTFDVSYNNSAIAIWEGESAFVLTISGFAKKKPWNNSNPNSMASLYASYVSTFSASSLMWGWLAIAFLISMICSFELSCQSTLIIWIVTISQLLKIQVRGD